MMKSHGFVCVSAWWSKKSTDNNNFKGLQQGTIHYKYITIQIWLTINLKGYLMGFNKPRCSNY